MATPSSLIAPWTVLRLLRTLRDGEATSTRIYSGVRAYLPSFCCRDVDTSTGSVVRTKLGEEKIIIGGEVDCLRGMSIASQYHGFQLIPCR